MYRKCVQFPVYIATLVYKSVAYTRMGRGLWSKKIPYNEKMGKKQATEGITFYTWLENGIQCQL